MSCFESNNTLYDCDARVLLNVYIHLVFLGEGWLALVPSHLPGLSQLSLESCDNMCDEYVEELMAAEPELEVILSVD
jgi:hypothetical protein